MSKLVVKNLNHSFGDKTVLKDINFSVEKGEFLSLVGPSGCGKSTLLKILANLLQPNEGVIERNDGDAKKISKVFQEANLLPWMNVEANVNLPLKLKGIKSDKAMEWLEKVGLANNAKQYPDELSGGMKMRVALARAMVMDPEVLLLDEPFGALDEITRQEMGDELIRFRELSPCTTIFVTHSVAEAVYLSERVALMSANPGLITELINIEYPESRSREWRSETNYLSQVSKLSKALQMTMAGGKDE